MLPEDGTHEYIQFLRRRGSITHIVSGKPGGKISTLALTQRCLANGISCPVPLPDGTVGINSPEGVPEALSGPEVTVEPLDDPIESDSQAKNQTSLPIARLQAIDAKLGKLETALSAGSQELQINTDKAHQEADFPPASDSAIAENTSCIMSGDDSARVDRNQADEAVAQLVNSVADHVSPETEPDSLLAGAKNTPSPEGEDNNLLNTDLQLSSEGPHNTTDQDPRGSADTNGDAARGDLVSQEVTEVPTFTEENVVKALSRQVTRMLEDISKSNLAISEMQSNLGRRLDTIESAISENVQKTLPRPDNSQVNASIAKMMTAFATGLRRLENATDVLGRQPSNLTGTQGETDDPLQTLAILQKTMALQVAALLESHRAPEVKELLKDVRHAIAELSESNSSFEKAS